MNLLFNNGTAYKILFIYNSKIFRQVTIVHTRLKRYIYVVYKSCKGINKLITMNSTSIHISKKCCDPHEFCEMNFLLAVEMLLTV